MQSRLKVESSLKDFLHEAFHLLCLWIDFDLVYDWMGTNRFSGLYRFSGLFGADRPSLLNRCITVFRKWEVDFFARLSFIMVDYYQCTAWKLIITTLCWRYKHGLLVLAFGIDVQTHRQKRFSSNNTIKECWFAFVKITISISCSFNTSPHICAWEVKYFFANCIGLWPHFIVSKGTILLFSKWHIDNVAYALHS